MNTTKKQEAMLEREHIANRRKHWVRAVTACNSRCVFCLDMDTPRNVFLPFEKVCAELRRGIEEFGADKVIVSGGEASLHPRFFDIIRYGKSIGYDRVQTVTNGWKYAERDFYKSAISAGLGEITFSLHGHTPELHDRLTQHRGSFKRLMKGMIRAVRDPKGPIVNVDVVINKQNVPHLDKIISLCASVGIREFDLLHVIPQSEAFRNRDMLFYDIREHQEVLHKVFRLNRHPGFVIWTNRFPVSYLEGLEDLIQDPHKMIDEVHGRRYHVRRYLDTGEPLDCREKERCVHCFIEPFCTTMDRFVQRQNEDKFDVWQLQNPHDDLPAELPFGCSVIGVQVDNANEIPRLHHPLEATVNTSGPLPEVEYPVRWIAKTTEQLERWLPELSPNQEVEIWLTEEIAKWMLEPENKKIVQAQLDRLRIHQPHYEKMNEAVQFDVRDPRKFFSMLNLPVRVSGLPQCLIGSGKQVPSIARLSPSLFDSANGRVDIRALSKHHIKNGYFAKSERCRDCALNDGCDGIHINMIRDQGLQLAQPIQNTQHPVPSLPRISKGMPPQKPASSAFGFGPPSAPPRDPLAVIGDEITEKRKVRIAKRMGRD